MRCEGDIRMWRGALSTASGTGLVELVARKHIAIYRNVRRAKTLWLQSTAARCGC
jgi:hypothetical protein